MWTWAMSSTLDFQGQVLKKPYPRKGMAERHGTKGMWIDRKSFPLDNFELWPPPWPWPSRSWMRSKFKFSNGHILGMWVGLWGFLWWAPSTNRKDHHGVSSGWSSIYISIDRSIYIICICSKPAHSWVRTGWLAEPLCKINPFPQQSKICFTGNAVENFEYNLSN